MSDIDDLLFGKESKVIDRQSNNCSFEGGQNTLQTKSDEMPDTSLQYHTKFKPLFML